MKLLATKKLATLCVLIGLSALPAIAAAATFKDVPVVDVKCSTSVQANPDAHTRACALACKGTGYGVWINHDKKYLKFNAAGNKMITKELEKSTQKDHLRVNVSGKVQGDTIAVSKVTLL